MDLRTQTTDVPRSYKDFQPSSELVRLEGSALIIDLPGFRQEQVSFQNDEQLSIVKITGERRLRDNKWCCFHKVFRVPTNCNINEINKSFDNGVLCIATPNIITKVEEQEQHAPTPTPTSQKSVPTASAEKQLNGRGSESDSGKNGAQKTPEEDKKRSDGSADARKVRNGTREKQETDNKYIDAGKIDGSTKNVIHGGGYTCTLEGLNKSRQLGVTAAVATLMVVAVGVYVTFTQRSPERATN